MIKRFQEKNKFPKQLWLLIGGLFFGMIGASMIWPFLMIYVSEMLGRPLVEIAGLITINGVVGLGASWVAGPLTDRLGRKWLMAISMMGNGLTYFLFIHTDTYMGFALLMALRGVFNPLYRVGINAMISDLVPEEDRADAYAMQRLASNSGIAVGPAIGGFLVTTSYTYGFSAAAITLTAFGLLIAFFTRETLPEDVKERASKSAKAEGYGEVVKDRHFLKFVGSYTLLNTTAVFLWVLLAVYAKQNYNLPENQFGFIQATNAVMVVVFQLTVTRLTKHKPPLIIMTIGSLIYALGVGSVALGAGFWGFWISFVVVTVGELMAMPTATTYVANLAPVDQRGRYMGFFNLAQGVASSAAPLLGGFLNDAIHPKAIWYGGGIIGIMGTIGFLFMALANQRETQLLKSQNPAV